MIAPTIHEDSNNGMQQPPKQEGGSSNARPSADGFSGRKDPSESGSSSPPDDEDDSSSDDSTDIRSKVHVRILPAVPVASLPDFPVRPAYEGEPTQVEKVEGERRLKLVIEILAEADLKRLQQEVM